MLRPESISVKVQLDLLVTETSHRSYGISALIEREVEEIFKGLFNDAGLPVKAGLWPNIQSGFS